MDVKKIKDKHKEAMDLFGDAIWSKKKSGDSEQIKTNLKKAYELEKEVTEYYLQSPSSSTLNNGVLCNCVASIAYQAGLYKESLEWCRRGLGIDDLHREIQYEILEVLELVIRELA